MHPLVPKYDQWATTVCRSMVGSLSLAGVGYVVNSVFLWWTFLIGTVFALGLMCALLWIANDLQRDFERTAPCTEDKPWYRS